MHATLLVLSGRCVSVTETPVLTFSREVLFPFLSLVRWLMVYKDGHHLGKEETVTGQAPPL